LPPLDLPDSNSDHATKPDRISGKKRTNFPEPTIATRLSYANRFSAPSSALDARDVADLFTSWETTNEALADMYNTRLFKYLRAVHPAQGGQSETAPAG